MSDRTHEAWILRLSDYLDGDMEGGEAQALEAHLAECATCRGVLQDLREIVARAGSLGEIQPPRDLWGGIAAAIETPGAGDPRVLAFPVPDRAVARRGRYLTVPQLAAASVILVAVSAAATWWAGMGLTGRGPTAGAVSDAPAASFVEDRGAPPPELARELASLEAVLAEARGRLDPNTLRILEKNLGVIQKAIDESRQALEVDPANAFLREHLERTYREKADFLREVTTIVGWEG